MLERQIEQAFVKKLEREGIRSLKLNLSHNRGWPDRLILLAGGHVLFIEFKTKKGKLRRLQKNRIETLQKLGYRVRVFDDAQLAFEWVLMEILRDVD